MMRDEFFRYTTLAPSKVGAMRKRNQQDTTEATEPLVAAHSQTDRINGSTSLLQRSHSYVQQRKKQGKKVFFSKAVSYCSSCSACSHNNQHPQQGATTREASPTSAIDFFQEEAQDTPQPNQLSPAAVDESLLRGFGASFLTADGRSINSKTTVHQANTSSSRVSLTKPGVINESAATLDSSFEGGMNASYACGQHCSRPLISDREATFQITSCSPPTELMDQIRDLGRGIRQFVASSRGSHNSGCSDDISFPDPTLLQKPEQKSKSVD